MLEILSDSNVNEEETDIDEIDDNSETDGCAGRCKDCILLKKFDASQIGYADFETVGKFAKVCFVGEAPGLDEIKEGRPFVGKAGSFLREELKALGLESYHLVNTMQCHPKLGKIRTPETEEIKHCSKNVKQFINENKPKLVIMLGLSACKGLMNEDFHKDKTVTAISKQKPVEINGVKYAVCFHPSYITRGGGKKAPQYADFVERLDYLINGGKKDDAPVVPFEIKNLDNLKEVLVSYMKETDLGFDYEGTSLSPFSREFKVLGFSLAANNPARSTYVDFHRPITDAEKKMLTMFLERKRPWTYNVNYELKVSWANISNSLIPFNDTFVLCKMDGSKGRLKDNARKHVGADYWEELVTGVRQLFESIFKRIDKLRKDIGILNLKKDPSEKQKSQLESLNQLNNALTTGDVSTIDILLEDDKNLAKFVKIKEDISDLYKFCSVDQAIRGITKYPNSWEAIPVEMTGEYCCYDSYYTLLLKQKLWEKHAQAYPYYISQAWAGSAMESYGLNWNDEVASGYEQYYFDQAIEYLYKLINMLEFGETRTELDKKGKQVEIKGTDDRRLDAYTIINDVSISKAEKLKQLKAIFNPQSNHENTRKIFFDKYTTDFVKAITFFYIIEEGIVGSPVIPDKAKELIDPLDLNKTVRALQFCDWATYCDGGANEALVRNIKNDVTKIIGSLESTKDSHLGKFAADIIEWQFRAHKGYGGLMTTIDDALDLKPESEWTEEFKLLYYLRRFKKVLKNQSTYINKKLGRQNVWLSKISENYSDPPKRIANYFSVDRSYKLKSDERWILDTDFNVLSAATLRWSSGIHTVPSSCELREIYEARNVDSMFLHLDYSQAEIRLLAALSGDKALLKAFEDGADIHTFIASKIFKILEKDVSKVQRKYSKSCCVHGDTKIRLMNGTVKPIKDLVGLTDVKIYSYDIKNNKIVQGNMTACLPVKKVNKIVKLTFDDGGTVKVTSDHNLLSRDSIYKHAQSLSVDDTIMPFNCRMSVKSRDGLEGYEILIDPDGSESFTHRRVVEQNDLDRKYKVVHHKDFNKRNNCIENLQLMSWKDHQNIHSRNCEENEFFSWSQQKRENQSIRMKQEAKLYKASRQFSGIKSRILQYIRDLLENNLYEKFDELRPYQLFIKKDNVLNFIGCTEQELIESAWHFDYSGKVPVGFCKKSQIEMSRKNMKSLWEDGKFRENHKIKQSKILTQLNSDQSFQQNTKYYKTVSLLKSIIVKADSKENLITNYENTVKICKQRNSNIKHAPSVEKINEYFGSIENAIIIAESYKNHSITKIEIIDEEVLVYDMQVDKFHNFCVMTSENSGIFVSNSFSITYGKSLQAFADEFMGGDLPATIKLFDDFFAAFPDVKKWIEARHKEAAETGKVTTFFGTTLTLDMRDFNGAMRAAQNWGVQSSASTLAAHCIYQNFKQAQEKKIPILPMVFTHDSHDMEFQTKELFEVIDNVYSAMVDIPLNEFKIPMKIDLEIGNTQGTTVKLEAEKQSDQTKRTYKFSSEESVLKTVFDRLSRHFDVQYVIEKTEIEKSSLEEMFLPKKAFSKYLGTEKTIVSGTVTLFKK